MKKISIYSLIIILIFSIPYLLYINWGSRNCTNQWVTNKSNGMVHQVLGKYGGFTRENTSRFHSNSERFQLNVQQHEQIVNWRSRSSQLSIDSGHLLEPEATFQSLIDVVYTDGTWHELYVNKDIQNYIPSCFLPIFPFQPEAPIGHYVNRSNETMESSDTQFVKQNGNIIWEYESFNISGHDWRQANLYNSLKPSEEDWTFIAIKAPEINSLASLQSFADYNKEQSDILMASQDEFHIQLLFHEPLSISKAQQIINQHDIKRITTQVQSLNYLGESVIWPLSLGNNEQTLQQQMNFHIQELKSESMMPVNIEKLELLGIVSLSGIVSPDDFNTIQNDENTFIVDITPTLVRKQIEEKTGESITDIDMIGNIPLAHLYEQYKE